MAFVMEFDARNNILRGTVTGYVGNEIILDTYAAVARYVTTQGPCRAITDLSGVTKGLRINNLHIREISYSLIA
jgi:hypothetical protein